MSFLEKIKNVVLKLKSPPGAKIGQVVVRLIFN